MLSNIYQAEKKRNIHFIGLGVLISTKSRDYKFIITATKNREELQKHLNGQPDRFHNHDVLKVEIKFVFPAFSDMINKYSCMGNN